MEKPDELCGKLGFLQKLRSLKVQFQLKNENGLAHSLASNIVGLILLYN